MGKTMLKGNPVNLAGEIPAVGAAAPAIRLVKPDMSEVTNATLAGKTTILLTLPSVDTPVCAIETRKFNEKAAAAQISVTATRSTALQLLNAGKITAADAKNVQAAADAGNAAIDLARHLEATDKTGAGAKLASAVAIITGVQAYLATKGASK